MNCICTSKIAILVNGATTKFFSPSRDIRQGCPLSPYIFILCMKMLSRLILHQVDIFLWDPIYLSNRDMDISHLFFTDDLTLISRANTKNYKIIHKCLNMVCNHSGQSINLQNLRSSSPKIVL